MFFGFSYPKTLTTKQPEKPSPALFGGMRVTSLNESGEGWMALIAFHSRAMGFCCSELLTL
jgi:hypothetical protein